MTIASNKTITQSLTTEPMTLEAYLTYDNGTDACYELVDGILVEMGAEADINIVIESFLFSIFLKFVPHYCIRKGTEIAIEGKYANTRFPDLAVLTESGVAALVGNQRSMVMFDMPAPAVVVEVVSSSDSNQASRDRDYVRKRKEYARRGIPEYWLIDPIDAVVFVMTLKNGEYQADQFVEDAMVVSPYFPQLKLSADQILSGGM